MTYRYRCLNPIAKIGLNRFTEDYIQTDTTQEAQAILVRSAKMLEMEFDPGLLCIARAGAGVNNIPLDRCAQKGIVVFNTPGANSNAVKEMVIAAMFLASRDIISGVEWVKANARDPEIAVLTEKEKKRFAGTEIAGKKLGIIGLGAIGVRVANAAKNLGMEVFGYDPYLSIDAAWNLSRDVHHVLSLDEICHGFSQYRRVGTRSLSGYSAPWRFYGGVGGQLCGDGGAGGQKLPGKRKYTQQRQLSGL